MNEREMINRILAVWNRLGDAETLKRLEAPQGPEQGLVAQAAERAERQGAAEDLRERGRVAPGEAEALVDKWTGQAARLTSQLHAMSRKGSYENSAPLWQTAASVLTDCARELRVLLFSKPEPESEADAPASPPTGQTSTEANP